MESSSQRNKILFDPIRKKWVDKTPEEVIRQLLIRQMVDQLGYPRALLAIEKELSQLPHLALTPAKELPKRRIDLLVFAKDAVGALVPLMLVECKAVPLTPKFAQQVLGYNSFVGAPFVTLANAEQILTGFFDSQAGVFRFEKGLPAFKNILDLLHNPISCP